MTVLVLPAGTDVLRIGDIPDMLALAQHPKSDAELERDAKFKAATTDENMAALLAQPLPPFTTALRRANARSQTIDALQKALADGVMTARNADSRAPLPIHATGPQLENAVVVVREFAAWAVGFEITVELEALQPQALHMAGVTHDVLRTLTEASDSAPAQSPATHAPVVAETPMQRRARWLAEFGKGERGALARIHKRELLTNPRADRSYIGKQITKAKDERAATKQSGGMFGQLVKDGSRIK